MQADIVDKTELHYTPQTEGVPMTMQVGLVGTDGIVLASDLKVLLFDGPTTSCLRSKLLLSPEKGLALAFSGGSLEIAEDVARKIVDDLSIADFDERHFKERQQQIESLAFTVCGQDVSGPVVSTEYGEVLIVSVRSLHEFYTIELNRKSPRFKAFRDQAIAGQSKNTACFFIDQYYKLGRATV